MTHYHHQAEATVVTLLVLVAGTSACLPGMGGGTSCGTPSCSKGYYQSYGSGGSYDEGPSYDSHGDSYAFASYKKGVAAAAPPPPSPPTEIMGLLPHMTTLFPVLGSYPNPFVNQPSPLQSPPQQMQVSASPTPEDYDLPPTTVIPESVSSSQSKVKYSMEGDRISRRIEGDNTDEKTTKPAPYLTYYNQQCSGEILGSSRGETVASASEKCARLNCQAANARATGGGKYDIVFLKTVQYRTNKRGIYCVSNVKVALKNSNRLSHDQSIKDTVSSTIPTKTASPPKFSSFKVAKTINQMEDDQLNKAIDTFNGRQRDEKPLPSITSTTIHPYVAAFFESESSSEEVDSSPTLPPSYYYKPGSRLI